MLGAGPCVVARPNGKNSWEEGALAQKCQSGKCDKSMFLMKSPAAHGKYSGLSNRINLSKI